MDLATFSKCCGSALYFSPDLVCERIDIGSSRTAFVQRLEFELLRIECGPATTDWFAALSKEVGGELHVLAYDRKTFYAFESNAGEPWIVPDLRFHDLDALLEDLDDADARVMPLEEAMSFVNDRPRP